jgi:hypothetical protein
MKKLWIVLVLTAGLSQLASAQKAVTDDFWFWSTVSVDKKISQKWGASFDEELRLFDNASRINLYFTNLGVNYKLTKNFKFALVYRFINKSRDGQPYSKRHRLYFDTYYKTKWNKFNFTYRVRFQGQVRDVNSSDKGPYIESYMRHKIDLKYSYKKFTPYVAAEFRFQFTNPHFNEGDDLWDRERFYLGLDYDITKKSSVGIYGMLQRDMNNERLQRDFVLGVEYSYSF